MATTAKLKKGDRAECTYKGETLVGVVARGGTKVTLIIDGGQRQISGDPSLFRASSAPLPTDDPSPMDRYGVSGYREYRGISRETVAFSCVILRDGAPFLFAENDGQGGPNRYGGMVLGKHSEPIQQFESDARAWFTQFTGEDHTFENGDIWLEFATSHKPYGILAAEYLRPFSQPLIAGAE